MNRIILTLLLLFSWGFTFSQDVKFSAKDSLRLVNLSELPLPDSYPQHKLPLPVSVDNSTQLFWRGLFWQSGCSCGQASSEGYVYTYEIDRARNLDASQNANRYPYSFTYNFLNLGNTVCGASWLESMDIIREAGIPNLVTSNNEMTDPNMNRWLTGYDKYYAAMQNRINNVYAIHVGTPQGLEILKQWLHNHLDGSAIGGLAFFYANHENYPPEVPAGTPEAGKHIITAFSNTSHSMTIVGYNDEVRYDYNNDGQFTNNIDITGDGVVDMRDWEIGALKIANSYAGNIPGGPFNWADQGFCYVMYRILPYHNGPGIWDKAAYVVNVKPTYTPLLTAKISMTYNSRDKIKVSVGVSTNPSAIAPDYVEDFPHFRYQGSDLYMQGGTSEADKTIEFGLDISELLNYVPAGQAARYFLIVNENDAAGSYSGTVNSFSVINYVAGGQEITSTQSAVPIANNSTTMLWTNASVNYSSISIVNDTIPKAQLNTYYTAQLQAQGGTQPYQWHPFYNYKITQLSNTFVPFTGTVLSNTKKNFTLPFSFPFYGKNYTEGTATTRGSIFFEYEDASVPYARDYSVLMRYFKAIAPFYGYYSASTIRFESNTNLARFYYNATLNGTNLEFIITLFPNGTIYIDYGNSQTPSDWEWQAGISKGDQISYQEFGFSGTNFPSNTRLILEPRPFPGELSIDDSGTISGVITQTFTSDSIFVKVIDNNWLYDTKGFSFSNSGILFSDYQISTLNNTVAEMGEVVNLSLSLTNVGEANLTNIQLKLSDIDPNYTLIDSIANVNSLPLSQTQSVSNAFQFLVSNGVPDNTIISLAVSAFSTFVSAYDTIQLVVRAPHLNIADLIYTDMVDSIFNPGDNGILNIQYINNGGSNLTGAFATILPASAWLTVNSIISNNQSLVAIGDTFTVSLNVSCDTLTPNGTLVSLPTILTGNSGFYQEIEAIVGIGLTIESFELNDTLILPWTFTGDSLWFEDTSYAFEGSQSLRSGIITHNQTSSVSIVSTVAMNGFIKFHKMVSSESGYDFLKFYIDSVELGSWSGALDWAQHAFPVQAGLHIFEWKYLKDVSVDNGLDAAFIDQIIFPASDFSLPELTLSGVIYEKEMIPDSMDTDTFLIYNTGGGLLNFSAHLDSLAILSKAPVHPSLQTRDITGSTVTVFPSEVYTGLPISVDIEIYDGSTDNEWIKELIINFPLGVKLDSATNFIGGTGGPMEWDGSLGNGTDASWFGEDTATGYGVVHNGQTARATLYLNIDTAIQNSVILFYTLKGEVYGAAPHEIQDVLILTNLGKNTTWLTLSQPTGSMYADGEAAILLNFNSFGIPLGEYACHMTIESAFDTSSVEIKLKVAYPPVISLNEYRNAARIYPNPAQDAFNIELKTDENLRLELFSSDGKIIKSQVLTSPISSIKTNDLCDGMYYVILTGKDARWVEKIIISH
ncbi:MAG: T9SS type A sorting domain-containing protein [Bacteroidales bacterium]|nr:T9SS type A sorting domain-containing protein [Bacteroidales bacterium]